jgi:hypothetical protein
VCAPSSVQRGAESRYRRPGWLFRSRAMRRAEGLQAAARGVMGIRGLRRESMRASVVGKRKNDGLWSCQKGCWECRRHAKAWCGVCRCTGLAKQCIATVDRHCEVVSRFFAPGDGPALFERIALLSHAMHPLQCIHCRFHWQRAAAPGDGDTASPARMVGG